MTEGDAREIADAVWQGLRWSLSDREIERFLESLPDSVDRLERCFRLAEASRVDLVGDLHKARSSLDRKTFLAMINELKEAVAGLFAFAEDIDGMAERLASTRPPDLTLEDGFVMAATLVKEGQRDAYRSPMAKVAANLRELLAAEHA